MGGAARGGIMGAVDDVFLEGTRGLAIATGGSSSEGNSSVFVFVGEASSTVTVDCSKFTAGFTRVAKM